MKMIAKIINKIIGLRKPKTNPLQEAIDEKIRNNSLNKKRKRNGNKNNKSK